MSCFDKKEIESILANSNSVLDEYYCRIKIDKGRLGHFTQKGIKITKAEYLSEIYRNYKINNDSDLCLHGLVIPNYDLKNIIKTKQLETTVIDIFSRMVVDLVNKKYKFVKDPTISAEDLEAECYKKIITCLCSYTDPKICLSTYIYTCISKHIYKISNSNGLSKPNKKSIELKKRYFEIKNSFLRKSNFDEIVEKMQISSKEVNLLLNSLRNVDKTIENIESENQVDFKNNIIEKSYSIDDLDIAELQKKISNFSVLEKAVLDGFLKSSGKKGITSVSKNLINPKTGKPYSRAAASLAWKKIKKELKSLAKKAA